MSWQTHSTKIRIGGTGGIILPVDSLVVRAEPYVAGGGRTALELYDGRMILMQPKFRVRATLEWEHLNGLYKPNEYGTIQQAVDTLLSNASGTLVYFYYDKRIDPNTSQPYGWLDSHRETMIPNLSDSTLQAVFNKKVRTKRTSLELVSTTSDKLHSELAWING